MNPNLLSLLSFILLFIIVSKRSLADVGSYQNQFAVHIPDAGHVDEVAREYGFVNRGQIGSLRGFYLFEHNHVRKRSAERSEEHVNLLENDARVSWHAQQRITRRVKRDYVGEEEPDIGKRSAETSRRTHFLNNTRSKRNFAFDEHLDLHPRSIGAHNVFPDPLFREQWYLNNGAKDGFDMNIAAAWRRGYTGKGVTVSILDDGIQTNHPDLAMNYVGVASTDINDGDDDPMPRDNGDNKHGTRCAGEVASVAFNAYCGVGVAYNSRIGGVRMLDGTVNDAVEAKALGLNINNIDIYSASWGPEDDGKTVDGPGPLARRSFIYGVTSGRHGKGSIFIWASGNGGKHTDSCNCDGYTNSIFTLSISSATQGGSKPWYLEECSSTLATTYSSGTPGYDKSVTTVDMDARLRPDHICTVEHTGTSASAPIAAGMVALALEANPHLTWRDVQHIVVRSSNPQPLLREPGWFANGVKKKYSHKFGYGLMDGDAMVALAEQWITVPTQHICKSQEALEDREIDPTPGNSLAVHMEASGCTDTLNDVRFLEHVQCKISLRFFPRGNLRIVLTSPMGTSSTLLHERSRDVVSSNFDDWPFMSVHYWGEKVDGRWTLSIHNVGNRHVNQPGVLRKWQLIFYGTSSNPVRLRTAPAAASPAIPFAISQTPSDSDFAANNGFYPSHIADIYSQTAFKNIPDIFAGAASENEGVWVLPPGVNDRERLAQNVRETVSRSDCDEQCDAQGCYGKEATMCIGCKNYKLDNACVQECPKRSFANHARMCWPCHHTCGECVAAGQDSCTTCAKGYYKLTDLGLCVQTCPSDYLQNEKEANCAPCKRNCATCAEKPDQCVSCEPPLVLLGRECVAACPLNTFRRNFSDSCDSCHQSCESCIGEGSRDCVSCKAGFFYSNGMCVETCPEGYHADLNQRECLPCGDNCAACTQDGRCSICAHSHQLTNSSYCVRDATACAVGMKEYEGTCKICRENCSSCVEPFLLEGAKCVNECGKSFYRTGSTCELCPHACESCLATTSIQCDSCKTGFVLSNGRCVTACNKGFFSSEGVCKRCALSCATCHGPLNDQCVSCPTGWQLASGECHAECPAGYYQDEFGCTRCNDRCRTCTGDGPTHCTSCTANYVLENGRCVECPGNHFYDSLTQLCKACDKGCRTCQGQAENCTACWSPLVLHASTKQCLPCCQKDATQRPCCDCAAGDCTDEKAISKRSDVTRTSSQEAQRSSRKAASLTSWSTWIVGVAAASCVLLSVLVFKYNHSSVADSYEPIPLR